MNERQDQEGRTTGQVLHTERTNENSNDSDRLSKTEQYDVLEDMYTLEKLCQQIKRDLVVHR